MVFSSVNKLMYAMFTFVISQTTIFKNTINGALGVMTFSIMTFVAVLLSDQVLQCCQ